MKLRVLTMAERSVRFNAIRVWEFDVKLMGTAPLLTAKAAFVNTDTGHTHGSTKSTRWSPETLALLKQLRESMESDLEKTHFADGVTTSGNPVSSGFNGLSEHLNMGNEDDAPQG